MPSTEPGLGGNKDDQEPPDSPLNVRIVPSKWSTGKSICDKWAFVTMCSTVYYKKVHEILLQIAVFETTIMRVWQLISTQLIFDKVINVLIY